MDETHEEHAYNIEMFLVDIIFLQENKQHHKTICLVYCNATIVIIGSEFNEILIIILVARSP